MRGETSQSKRSRQSGPVSIPESSGCHGMVCFECALHVCLIRKSHGVSCVGQRQALRQQTPGTIDAQVSKVRTWRHPAGSLEASDKP